jgi:hypothetical protein
MQEHQHVPPVVSYWDTDATQRLVQWVYAALRYTALLALKIAAVCAILSALFIVSALFYAFLYWMLIPESTLFVPAYLDYKPAKGSLPFPANHTGDYTFAQTSINLVGKQYEIVHPELLQLAGNKKSLLSSKEAYDVFLEIEFPHWYLNDACGVFVVDSALNHNSAVLLARSSRSFVPSKSTLLVRYLRRMMLLGPILVGVVKETESLHLRLFEEYVEHPSYRATQLVLSMSGDKLLVSESRVRFEVRLSGVRWFLQNWFLTSASIGILNIFMLNCVCLSGLGVYIWHRSRRLVVEHNKRD